MATLTSAKLAPAPAAAARAPVVLRPVSTLRQQVIDALRGCITNLTFKPGDRLIERELCEMLGVSRTLVREGLAQLMAEGLVQNIPHKGPIVTVVTPREARGLYDVRAQLEGMAAARFVKLATPQQRQDLKAAFQQLKNPGEEDPILHFLKAKGAFYDALLNGTDNPVLTDMLRLMHTRVTLLRATTLSQPGRLEESYKEIKAIMTAIDKKDPEAAARAAEQHVKRAEEIALEVLAQTQGG